MLRKEARWLKVGIKDVDVSKITKFRVPDNVDKRKNLDKTRLEKKIRKSVNYHNLKPDVSEEDLFWRVKTQEWPNLVVKEVPRKGKVVFTVKCHSTVEMWNAITTAMIYPARKVKEGLKNMETIKRKKITSYFSRMLKEKKAYRWS